MGSNKDRAIRYRKQGKSYEEIAKTLDVNKTTVWGYLKAAGLVKSYRKPEKIGKKIGPPDEPKSRIPMGLNGLSRHWRSAEKLIDRAKRIKAAVKELNKALHS